jgi:hypothetical protein
MIIVTIIMTEDTSNSAIRAPCPNPRITMIITIYPAIITGASLHLIADGSTRTLNMAGPIRMYKTTDNIRGLMTGEIKSKGHGIMSMKMMNAAIMKIMNRPRIKEKAAAGIISNGLTVTMAIQMNE